MGRLGFNWVKKFGNWASVNGLRVFGSLRFENWVKGFRNWVSLDLEFQKGKRASRNGLKGLGLNGCR